MIADNAFTPSDLDRPRRLASDALRLLVKLWTCWWWAWRAHVAAMHGLPRSSLEAPPSEWLRPLAAPPPTLPRRRGPS